LEISWRPRDVIITQIPTHQHFARHASHSRCLAEENKWISYCGRERRWGGGEEHREGDEAKEGRNGGKKIVKGMERDESRKQRNGGGHGGIMRGKEVENDGLSLQTTPCW